MAEGRIKFVEGANRGVIGVNSDQILEYRFTPQGLLAVKTSDDHWIAYSSSAWIYIQDPPGDPIGSGDIAQSVATADERQPSEPVIIDRVRLGGS